MSRKKSWWDEPERRPLDTRDADEHAAVTVALSNLPPDHPARRAYAEGADTVKLTHLVADRRDIIAALTEAYLAGWRRSLARWSGFRP